MRLPNPNAKDCPKTIEVEDGAWCTTWNLEGTKRIWVFIPN